MDAPETPGNRVTPDFVRPASTPPAAESYGWFSAFLSRAWQFSTSSLPVFLLVIALTSALTQIWNRVDTRFEREIDKLDEHVEEQIGQVNTQLGDIKQNTDSRFDQTSQNIRDMEQRINSSINQLTSNVIDNVITLSKEVGELKGKVAQTDTGAIQKSALAPPSPSTQRGVQQWYAIPNTAVLLRVSTPQPQLEKNPPSP